jgi:plasmid stability protein
VFCVPVRWRAWRPPDAFDDAVVLTGVLAAELERARARDVWLPVRLANPHDGFQRKEDRNASLSIQYVLILRYYVYVGTLLQIRNVPDDARRALKARAAAQGQSLNSYLLELITREVTRPTVGEVLDRSARRAERAAGSAVKVIDNARAERDTQLRRTE